MSEKDKPVLDSPIRRTQRHSEKEKYEGYDWIKVERFKPEGHNPQVCEGFDFYVDHLEKQLELFEKHHIEETTFLIEKVRELAATIDTLRGTLAYYRRQEEAQIKARNRQARHEADYLPYQEDEYDR